MAAIPRQSHEAYRINVAFIAYGGKPGEGTLDLPPMILQASPFTAVLARIDGHVLVGRRGTAIVVGALKLYENIAAGVYPLDFAYVVDHLDVLGVQFPGLVVGGLGERVPVRVVGRHVEPRLPPAVDNGGILLTHQ